MSKSCPPSFTQTHNLSHTLTHQQWQHTLTLWDSNHSHRTTLTHIPDLSPLLIHSATHILYTCICHLILQNHPFIFTNLISFIHPNNFSPFHPPPNLHTPHTPYTEHTHHTISKTSTSLCIHTLINIQHTHSSHKHLITPISSLLLSNHWWHVHLYVYL